MGRVLTPSLSIIYPPYSENSRKGLFLFFSPFPLLDKRKYGGNSCLTRHLRIQNAKPVYNSWFCHRITLMMPYPTILPVFVEPIAEGDTPYILLHPNIPIDFEELQRSWIQLKGERDTFEAQLYASEKKCWS